MGSFVRNMIYYYSYISITTLPANKYYFKIKKPPGKNPEALILTQTLLIFFVGDSINPDYHIRTFDIKDFNSVARPSLQGKSRSL